ncbi:hypothetical protein KIPE111705_12415 [Kibdelosporangium persicum]|uniref:hypothetical protein n=1 Tax=Kibdelosporangium persicum TaxID=2698649 RepID=UPI001563B3AD|nr:hypothetical protein [Kibdelosporangium persicum]
MSFDLRQEGGRAERRETFFATYLEPMVNEAKAIGIPMTDVFERIIQHLSNEDTQ